MLFRRRMRLKVDRKSNNSEFLRLPSAINTSAIATSFSVDTRKQMTNNTDFTQLDQQQKYRKSPCISRFFFSKIVSKTTTAAYTRVQEKYIFSANIMGSSRGLLTFPNINCFKCNFSQLFFVFLGEKPTKEFKWCLIPLPVSVLMPLRPLNPS